MRSIVRIWTAGVVLVLVLVLGLADVGAQKDRTLKVTATQLAADYRSNKKAADEKYKDKDLQITGVVRQVIVNGSARYLTLEGAQKYDSFSPTCVFSKENQEAVQKLVKSNQLVKGATITLRGKCEGLNVGSPRLQDCVMIKPAFPK